MDTFIEDCNQCLKQFATENHHGDYPPLSTDNYFDLTCFPINLGLLNYGGIFFVMGRSVIDKSVNVYMGSNMACTTAISAGITHCIHQRRWKAGKGFFDPDFMVYFNRVYVLPLSNIGDKRAGNKLKLYLKEHLKTNLLCRTRKQ